MDMDQYKQRVTVRIVPEEPHKPHPSGKAGLAGDTRFWLYTAGLNDFGRHELEMRDVPAMFVVAAGHEINHWGHYSAATKPLLPGQRMRTEGVMPLILKIETSPDPFYAERGIDCIRIRTEAVVFLCECCDHATRGLH